MDGRRERLLNSRVSVLSLIVQHTKSSSNTRKEEVCGRHDVQQWVVLSVVCHRLKSKRTPILSKRGFLPL